MRSAFQAARLEVSQDGNNSLPVPSAEDMFALATIDGARSAWLDQRTGTLTPGKEADIILLTTNTLNLSPINDPVASVVLGAYASNVDTVLVAGKVLKQGGRLLHVDLEQVRTQATTSRNYLMATSGFRKTSYHANRIVSLTPVFIFFNLYNSISSYRFLKHFPFHT